MALREELEELDTSLFGVNDEGIQDQNSPVQNLQQDRMTTIKFELYSYAGDINPAKSEGRKLFLAATKEKDSDKKFLSSRTTQSSSWRQCFMIPTNFVGNRLFITCQLSETKLF